MYNSYPVFPQCLVSYLPREIMPVPPAEKCNGVDWAQTLLRANNVALGIVLMALSPN